MSELDGFAIPPIDGAFTLPNKALAEFLEMVEFTVQSVDEPLGKKLVVGKNLFVDFLPSWYYEDDEDFQNQPGETLVVLFLEPLVGSESLGSYNHKLDSLVRVEVNHGSRDAALLDATRLWQFFLRRENVVQFESCGISVRHVRPNEPPSLVGEDESSRAVYAFRLILRSIVSQSI